MKQRGTGLFAAALAIACAGPVAASDTASPMPPGFYGGVSLRDRATEAAGVGFAAPDSVWNRYVAPVADDTASRALIFGGYRLRPDLAVEAAFSSVDKYALRPAGAAGFRGVGLNLAPGAGGLGELQTRSWNLDVFTTWT